MEEFREELARGFANVWISLQMGISQKAARKYSHESNVEIGKLWLTLADITIETFTGKNGDQQLNVVEKVVDKGIR